MSERSLSVPRTAPRAIPAAPRAALTHLDQLVEAGLVAPEAAPALAPVAQLYAIGVTPHLAGLIDPQSPADPLARQYLPSAAEADLAPYEIADPIGDDAHEAVPGVIHRYPDRVLLLPVKACAVYCRFCFRRASVGPGQGALTPAERDAALAYIAGRPGIREVILSGGDPMVMAPRRLLGWLDDLAAIAHVETLRIHTRIPVAAPERIEPALLEGLARMAKPVWLVLHVNHARELEPEPVRAALASLARAGVPLVSQSVLLRGVNDDAATLEALFRALLRLKVKPYYLHMLDPAPGTSHFRVPLAEAQRLMRELRQRLTGLGLPALTQERPGGAGKIPVGPRYEPALFTEDAAHTR